MPVDMSKYPDDWQDVRVRILQRAGGNDEDPRVGARCEFCGVKNYTVRLSDGMVHSQCSDYKSARRVADHHNRYAEDWAPAAAVVVLTIAHLEDPNPMNCADDNLAALCQKCHNTYDMDMRKRNRQQSAIQAQIDNGQMVLL